MMYIIGMRSRCDDSYTGYYDGGPCYWTTDLTRAYKFATQQGATVLAHYLRQRYPTQAGFIDTIGMEE
jgi:hypothetical protein